MMNNNFKKILILFVLLITASLAFSTFVSAESINYYPDDDSPSFDVEPFVISEMVKNNTNDGYIGNLIGENKTYIVKMSQEDWDHIENLTDNDPYGKTIYIQMLNDTIPNQCLILDFYNSNGELISFDDSYSDTATNTNTDSSVSYVASANSDKFHDPSCSAANKIKDANKVTFSSREEAINSGYQPCGICNP